MYNSFSRLVISLAIVLSCFLSSDGTLRKTDAVYLDYPDTSKFAGSLCYRECIRGEARICYFQFTLEFYHAMGPACGSCKQGNERDCRLKGCIVGDGFEKNVMSINRQVPGPPIHVCQDDIVIVDFHNEAHGTSDALHWHGVHMAKTPYMDGVPFVTQCPIPYSTSFRYQFRASEAGTQFYHSHAGHHKANGEYGALIIREPPNSRSRSLYDRDFPEHYILISDWMHTPAEHQFPGLATPNGIFADSIIINGRGVYTDPATQQRNNIRPHIFYVKAGNRYRFRLINSMNHACPVQIQIQGHNFTIIASDSFDVEPQTFDTLVSNAGERYDFVLAANHSDGDFWLRARGFGACADRNLESYALIRYTTKENVNNANDSPVPPFPNYNQPYPIVSSLNHPNASCWSGSGNKCVTDLLATTRDKELLGSTPHFKFFLGFDNYNIPNEEIFRSGQYLHFANVRANNTVVGGINNLSLVYPDFPPLTQPELIDSNTFCNFFERPNNCGGKHVCHCTHRLKVHLNSIVELVIVDETESVNRINHPFHLHGYDFRVVGMGTSPYTTPFNVRQAQRLEDQQMLIRNGFSTNPPRKDTVSIPSRGYAIVRLRANNPGFWLMHCHYEWHLAIGMSLMFQVGETSQMVKPPINFPKCNSFIPKRRNPSFLDGITGLLGGLSVRIGT